MPIVNVKIPTEKISVGEGHIELRGIGFPEIAQLIDSNYDKLAPFFDRLTGKDKKNPLTMDNIGAVPSELLITLPGVVVHIICLAADTSDPGDIEIVRKLPADVQLMALEKIIGLSVKAAGGAAPFLEIVTRMLAGVNDLSGSVSNKLNQALPSGSKG